MRKCGIVLVVCLLAACGERHQPAPVMELRWQPHSARQTIHIVKHDETLYAIAFRYDRDYRQLAAYNHLRAPYEVHAGQVIHLNYLSTSSMPPRSSTYLTPVKAKPKLNPASLPVNKKNTAQPTVQKSSSHWLWPAKGKVVAHFSPQVGKKGIDIAGKKGDEVFASSSGVVAYAGSGLSGYGNLIIIKHEGQYLTAYGNNLKNRVKEGQKVKAGDIIADMGMIDRKFWGVHFEIRKAGQPINPMNLL